jgi:hypothetical protein
MEIAGCAENLERERPKAGRPIGPMLENLRALHSRSRRSLVRDYKSILADRGSLPHTKKCFARSPSGKIAGCAENLERERPKAR